MTRLPRRDFVGQWHHVMHRGIARRAVFETDRDIRAFLSLVAREVRRERIEVHSFAILTTHFHLLVRCPEGGLGLAFGHVLNSYVRWFNRGRRRDGALFRGRFRSRPVNSEAYRRLLVRYIDENPVQAGLVCDPRQYPHGSARRFVSRHPTPWLERSWISQVVADRAEGAALDAQSYERAFGHALDARARRLVDRRFESPPNLGDPLDDLLAAAPERVLAWMRKKAAVADGTPLGLPICDAEDVSRAVADARADRGDWGLRGASSKSKLRDAWVQLENGLLRDLCATTCAETAKHVGRTPSWSSAAHRVHREMLVSDTDYASIATSVAGRALERTRELYGGSLLRTRNGG